MPLDKNSTGVNTVFFEVNFLAVLDFDVKEIFNLELIFFLKKIMDKNLGLIFFDCFKLVKHCKTVSYK